MVSYLLLEKAKDPRDLVQKSNAGHRLQGATGDSALVVGGELEQSDGDSVLRFLNRLRGKYTARRTDTNRHTEDVFAELVDVLQKRSASREDQACRQNLTIGGAFELAQNEFEYLLLPCRDDGAELMLDQRVRSTCRGLKGQGLVAIFAFRTDKTVLPLQLFGLAGADIENDRKVLRDVVTAKRDLAYVQQRALENSEV